MVGVRGFEYPFITTNNPLKHRIYGGFQSVFTTVTNFNVIPLTKGF